MLQWPSKNTWGRNDHNFGLLQSMEHSRQQIIGTVPTRLNCSMKAQWLTFTSLRDYQSGTWSQPCVWSSQSTPSSRLLLLLLLFHPSVQCTPVTHTHTCLSAAAMTGGPIGSWTQEDYTPYRYTVLLLLMQVRDFRKQCVVLRRILPQWIPH